MTGDGARDNAARPAFEGEGQLRRATTNPESEAGRARTPGLPPAAVVALSLAALWISVQGVKAASGILAPTLLALTLTLSVQPLQSWLVRRKVPGWMAALVCLLLLYALLIGLVASLGYSAAALAEKAPDYTGQAKDLWNKTATLLASHGVEGPQIQQALSKIDPNSVMSFVTTLFSTLTDASSKLLLMVTVMMFLSMDSLDMPRRMELIAIVKPGLAEGFSRFSHGVRSYWVVTTVFGLIVAVLDYAALVAMGIPLALTWGVLSFITNYIPNIGLVIGMVPPAILALLEKDWKMMVAVIVVYLVLNFVVQTLIQPKFTGDAVGITATVSFLSLIFWAYVLGVLGALLAIPMTLMVKSLLVDVDPGMRWLNALIASKPHAQPLDLIQQPLAEQQEDDRNPEAIWRRLMHLHDRDRS